MNDNTYIRIRLIQVPSQFEDLITGLCFDHGASGVTEVLAFSQPDLTYDPDLIPVKSHELDAFFMVTPPNTFFDKLREWVPRIKWEVVEEQNKDWLAEWKKGFVPFHLVGSFWVVPSWHEPPAAASKPIFIDPGMAFGTGTHATTQIAAYFVNKLCLSFPRPQEISLIDVGTGTGILAMLASSLKIGRCLGVEIDPEARRVARENIKKNNLHEAIEISDQEIEKISEKFDVVVANIIDGVLVRIRNELLRCLKPGGDIFLTGILLEREEDFLNGFLLDESLQVVRRVEKEEWVGYWLRLEKAKIKANP